MSRVFIFLGSLNAFLAVTLGAYGAHALKGRLSAEMLAIYGTGSNYHIVHSLGLILVGIIAHWAVHSRLLFWAGCLLFAGMGLFSGSLYVVSLTESRFFWSDYPCRRILFPRWLAESWFGSAQEIRSSIRSL